ncbi:hypothetical protein PAHAL_2G161400 [Panicum hallii]|uniref:Uncharacterized protein n=1 Tax=Panicum hallii TaxID=206008 RepID=A0A2T8KPA5_9POAL|nr:hypothetical protein PAHAL_2G161400 [Panicum hallii]
MTRTAGPALAPHLCASTLCYASTRRHQLARHAHHSLRAHSRTSRACAVPSARVCSCASARLSRISALGCAARSHHRCSACQRSPPWVTTGPPAAWATAACRSRAHTCGRTEPRLLGLRLLTPRAPACPRAAPGPAARPPVLPLASRDARCRAIPAPVRPAEPGRRRACAGSLPRGPIHAVRRSILASHAPAMRPRTPGRCSASATPCLSARPSHRSLHQPRAPRTAAARFGFRSPRAWAARSARVGRSPPGLAPLRAPPSRWSPRAPPPGARHRLPRTAALRPCARVAPLRPAGAAYAWSRAHRLASNSCARSRLGRASAPTRRRTSTWARSPSLLPRLELARPLLPGAGAPLGAALRYLCRGGEREGGAGGVKDWGQSKVSPVGEKRKGKTELDRTAAGGKRDKAPEEELRGSDAWNSCSRMWQGWSAQRRLQSRN